MRYHSLDLPFSFLVDLEVHLSALFREFPFEVLPHHDKGEEDELDHIRSEKPDHKCRSGVETERDGSPKVPEEPADGPEGQDEEETHGAHTLCHHDSEALELREALILDLFPRHF